MNEYNKEKERLLRRAKEETVLLNCAAKQAAASVYKLNIIHENLLNLKDKYDMQ